VQAWLSILLAVFVIAELTIFIGVLNETAVTLLVAPLARILTVLRTQAARVMKSMERNEACPLQDRAAWEWVAHQNIQNRCRSSPLYRMVHACSGALRCVWHVNAIELALLSLYSGPGGTASPTVSHRAAASLVSSL